MDLESNKASPYHLPPLVSLRQLLLLLLLLLLA
jgi:hypothetical protein